jgi:Zn-dependent peptidase ImmA (M78 family)
MHVGDFTKSSDPNLTALNLVEAIENLEFPIDIENIAIGVGIKEIEEIPTDKFEGMLVAIQDKTVGFINISKNIRENTRKRFTIAHELGHFLIPSHKNAYSCSSYDLNNYHDNKWPHEVEANQFAAELLMPRTYFTQEIIDKDPSFGLIQLLTSKFGASLTSTLVRFKDLTHENVAVVLSENLIIKWALRSTGFKYYIESNVNLSPESYAIKYFSGNELALEFEEVERDTWFDASDIKHRMNVMELSIPLPYYNQVISMIWLIEDEDEIEDREDEFDGYLKLKERF